jgi:sulfur carrier protein ThiS
MSPPVPLQSTGPGPLVSLAFVAVGIGVLVLFARGSVGRLLTMLRTEQRSVAAVKPGLVEIEGEVVPAEETVSSRTLETGYSDAVVTQYRQSGGNTGDGQERNFTLPVPQQFAPEVLNEETAVPFYVEDETGKILVDPAYADISLKSDHSEHDNLSDRTEVEAILQPGETVYVLGQAVPASSYNQKATRRGGIVRSIVRFVRGSTDTTADEAIAKDDDLVITRTSPSSEFLISDTSERRGQLRMGLMAAFWTLSGLIATGGGVYFLVAGII